MTQPSHSQGHPQGPVPVPCFVAKGLEEVRRSGETNMFDRVRVIELLYERGHQYAAQWCIDHKSLYGVMIIQGITADDSI